MQKYRVLLVVTEFWQAGCQKYNYEMDKWINKDRFETQILCYHDIGSNPDWEDYYYPLHQEFGTKINFLSDFKTRYGRIRKKEGVDKEGLNSFVDSFDTVIFQGEYCWAGFARYFTYNKKKFYISIHNSIVQAEENYAGFDRSLKHNFITSFTPELAKYEFQEFDDYNFYHFPLSISAKWENEWKPEFFNSKRIGIFTRLTKGKPITPFLYSFHLLRDKIPDAKLLIFGNGDPEEAGIMEHVNLLNLNDSVQFMGHAQDIVESAVEHELSLVFFHGYHHMPGGFASFQLSSAGIPQLFFEMIPQDLTERDVVLYSTNSVRAYTDKAVGLLNNKEALTKLSADQFVVNKEQRDIEKNIVDLEDYLISRI